MRVSISCIFGIAIANAKQNCVHTVCVFGNSETENGHTKQKTYKYFGCWFGQPLTATAHTHKPTKSHRYSDGIFEQIPAQPTH